MTDKIAVNLVSVAYFSGVGARVSHFRLGPKSVYYKTLKLCARSTLNGLSYQSASPPYLYLSQRPKNVFAIFYYSNFLSLLLLGV